MNEELITKNRLIIKDQAINRCIKKYSALILAINKKESEATIHFLMQQLKEELTRFSLSLASFELASLGFVKEKQSLEEDDRDINSKIIANKNIIKTLETRLKIERDACKQKMEYDKIRQKLLQYDTREKLISQIAILEADIERLEAERTVQLQCSTIAKDKILELTNQIKEYRELINSIEKDPSSFLTNFKQNNPSYSFEPIKNENNETENVKDENGFNDKRNSSSETGEVSEDELVEQMIKSDNSPLSNPDSRNTSPRDNSDDLISPEVFKKQELSSGECSDQGNYDANLKEDSDSRSPNLKRSPPFEEGEIEAESPKHFKSEENN